MARVNPVVRLKRSLMMLLAASVLTPGTASACTACMFQLFEEIFPFLTPWAMTFLGWSVIFIIWNFASPKGKALSLKAGRISLELVILFLLIVFTGYSVLLFYWAFVVGRQFWLSLEKDGRDLSPGVRKFSLFFNGLTALILTVSVAVSYAGHDSPENLVKRLGKHYGGYGFAEANLNKKIIARGPDAAPALRKAVLDGISDPLCKNQQNFYGPVSCMRAENAAGLLGDMKDLQSLDVLVSAATMTGVEARISETAGRALKKIGSEAVLPLLRNPDPATRTAARNALSIIDGEPVH